MSELLITGKTSKLYPDVPDWTKSIYDSPPQVLRVSDEALAAVRRGALALERTNGNKSNGQKGYEGKIYMDKGDLIKGTVVMLENGDLEITRNRRWWRDEDQDSSRVPDYAVSINPYIAFRTLKEERKVMSYGDIYVSSHGNEQEYATVQISNNSVLPVNTQNVIRYLHEIGVPASIEGWVCQLEQPSSYRKESESINDYRDRLIANQRNLSLVLDQLGVSLLPISVMPFNPCGLPNFENPHVQRVLTKGIEASLGRDVSVSEAVKILEGFNTNGLHITVNLVSDSKGRVGDERMCRVFNETHPKAIALLKAMTLSGNISYEALIEDVLSFRERQRSNLPTARVGEAIPFSKAMEGVIVGNAPSLERASLVKREGDNLIYGGSAHNPLGRQKEIGAIEFTVFDVEPNLDKVIALETLLRYYVAAVDRAVLRDPEDPLNIENVKNNMSGFTGEFFLGNITDQTVYEKIVSLVDKHGLQGEIECNTDGEKYRISKILKNFINWIWEFSYLQGLISEDDQSFLEDKKQFEYLLSVLDDSRIANDFYSYMSPNSICYGIGSFAEVARNRFNVLRKEGYTVDSAVNLLIQETAGAFHMHLKSLNDL